MTEFADFTPEIRTAENLHKIAKGMDVSLGTFIDYVLSCCNTAAKSGLYSVKILCTCHDPARSDINAALEKLGYRVGYTQGGSGSWALGVYWDLT